MLIKEALAWAVSELDNFSSKQLESRILLANILNSTQEFLLLSYNKEISEDDKIKFFEHVQRRKLFEPIAYIIEKKEFYSIDFLVNNYVLIPREDTEILVDAVINEYKNNYLNDGELKVLDLGTGSGAITISIAVNIPITKIFATDISKNALILAKKNAKLNNVADQIEFIESNWYFALSPQKFDFIVSNPPYISVDDKIYMAEETLQYEPELSLFADNQGLVNYDQIIHGATKFLKNYGKIFLEIGFNQSSAVTAILKKYGFSEIKILQDLAGRDRVITATYT